MKNLCFLFSPFLKRNWSHKSRLWCCTGGWLTLKVNKPKQGIYIEENSSRRAKWRRAQEKSLKGQEAGIPDRRLTGTDGPSFLRCLLCILQQTSAPEHHRRHSADQGVCHTKATAAIMSIFILYVRKIIALNFIYFIFFTRGLHTF